MEALPFNMNRLMIETSQEVESIVEPIKES